MKKIDDKVMEKLFKGAKSKLIATSNGVAVEGDLISILGSFSILTIQMIDGGIPKDMVKHAFEVALENVKEDNVKENKEAKEELRRMVKEVLTEIKNNLNELLGDEEDE